MKKRYYTGQIHLVKSHYEFMILTILQGEFDQCSTHPFHLYQKIENGKNRYVEAQSAGQPLSQATHISRLRGAIYEIYRQAVLSMIDGVPKSAMMHIYNSAGVHCSYAKNCSFSAQF